MSRSAPVKTNVLATFTTFGDLLRYLRQRRQLTQRDLALATGYSISQISRLEHNDRLPNPATVRASFIPALHLQHEPELAMQLLDLATPPQGQMRRGSKQTPCHTLTVSTPEPVPGARQGSIHGPLPEIPFFYGREAELAQLQRWIVDEQCRLVAILGMGGMGKTALAAHLATPLSASFDLTIWSSLLNAPPFAEIANEWLHQLTPTLGTDLPTRVDDQLALLLHGLQRQRCLLILDNVESILQTGAAAGSYRPGYEEYGQLLQQISLRPHHSCLLLTSRERPQPLGRLERDTTVVHALVLSGLPTIDAHWLIARPGIVASTELEEGLVRRYSGNPLALKLVIETVWELFGGNLALFLGSTTATDQISATTPIFDDMRRVLDQQWSRLSKLEQEITTWLAVVRQPVTAQELLENLHLPQSRAAFVTALRALGRRALLEHQAQFLTLSNVVIEYVTEHLIEQLYHEVETEQLQYLHHVALLQTMTAEYIRQSQQRMIVQPLAERLVKHFGRKALQQKLPRLLNQLRTRPIEQQGYAAGNLLNLALSLGMDLAGWDLSDLAIWQADLRTARLHHINCAGADFRTTRFRDTFGAIYCLAFSLDGQLLAAGASDFQIRIWQVATQRSYRVLEGHTQYVWGVAFSPHGHLLASCSLDGTVRLWDVEVAQCLHTLQGHTQGVRQVAFSPEGKTLASVALDGSVRLWDVETATLRAVLEGHQGGVMALAFNATGQWLVTGGDEFHLRLWEVQSGRLLRLLAGHTSYITSVAFSTDGNSLASGGGDHTIRLWDAHSGALLTTLTGHRDAVHSLAFCQDDKLLVSGAGDRTVRLWDCASGQCVQILGHHASPIWAVAGSRDGQVVASAGDDKTIRLWHSRERRLVAVLQGYTGAMSQLSFVDDGAQLAAAGSDGDIHLWNLPHYQHQAVLPGHQGIVRGLVAHAANNLLASGGDDGAVQVWDMRYKQRLALLHGHSKAVRALAFDPSGNLLASAGDEPAIYLWEVGQQPPIASWQAHRLSIWSLAFHPHHTLLASAGMDPEVKLWQVPSRQLMRTIYIGAGGNRCLAFSPDGCFLAIASDDGSIRIWDLQAERIIQHLPGHTQMAYALAFSTDSTRLVSAGYDKTINVWHFQAGSLVTEVPQVLAGHTNAVLGVAFHPRLPLIASCSMDKTLKIWDALSSACLATLRAPRPYEEMNIAGATGLSNAQKSALLTLGALNYETTEPNASAKHE